MPELIAVYDSFPAAHRIRIDDAGTQEPVHVHHWRACVRFEARDTMRAAADVRQWLETWVGRHRGRSLNDVPPYGDVSPTAEHVARHLAAEFDSAFLDHRLVEVTIGEAAGFSATFVPSGAPQ
ncbi:MAG: hypothetical protein GKS06_16345 [Acidobacteria bacterium]|nr:hypothetical protein [Acidobacteriota bacterium]